MCLLRERCGRCEWLQVSLFIMCTHLGPYLNLPRYMFSSSGRFTHHARGAGPGGAAGPGVHLGCAHTGADEPPERGRRPARSGSEIKSAGCISESRI